MSKQVKLTMKLEEKERTDDIKCNIRGVKLRTWLYGAQGS